MLSSKEKFVFEKHLEGRKRSRLNVVGQKAFVFGEEIKAGRWGSEVFLKRILVARHLTFGDVGQGTSLASVLPAFPVLESVSTVNSLCTFDVVFDVFIEQV